MENDQNDGLKITDVSEMNVIKLKENLRKRNLSYQGKKDDLKKRLLQSINVEDLDFKHNHKNFVNIDDFDVLVSDFADFKQYVTDKLNRIYDEKHVEERLTTLERENHFLRDELNNKKEIINILMKDNECLRNETLQVPDKNKAPVNRPTGNNNLHQTLLNNNKAALNVTKQKNNTTSFQLQTSNRFANLDNEPSFNVWNNDDNSFVRKKRNFNNNGNNNNNNGNNNRFIVQNPENNSKFHHKSTNKRTTYSRKKRKVLIVGDSIIKYVSHRRLNNQLNGGKVFVKSFPGATVSQLEHYIVPHLFEQAPDSVVLHIGTNNIRPRFPSHEKSSLEIANSVISIAMKCVEYGVKDIFISSITCRANEIDMEKIMETNCHLMNLCAENQFHFISNSNIQLTDLWEDGLHLANSGVNILTENFFTSLDRNLI